MKLSRQEREFLKRNPRNLSDFNSCLKTASGVNDMYNSRMRRSIEFLIQLYVYDCTISFDEASKKMQEKFSISQDEVIKYLKSALLLPYSHNNSSMLISKKIFNQSFNNLEEAEKGLTEYLSNPTLLLQHLAYFASTHSHSNYIENFLSITLKLPRENDHFIIASESIFLLSFCPKLTRESLSRLLTYRIGIPLPIIENSLTLSIDTYFCPKVYKFLEERLGVKKGDSFFELCNKKADFMRTVNFPLQF